MFRDNYNETNDKNLDVILMMLWIVYEKLTRKFFCNLLGTNCAEKDLCKN